LGDLQVRFRIQEGVQELAYQRFKRRALTPTELKTRRILDLGYLPAVGSAARCFLRIR